MIKLEHTEVTGWEAAIRGMRNPMNSWDKSDTFCNFKKCRECSDRLKCDFAMLPGPPAARPYRSTSLDFHYIGPNDLDLMMRLARAGSVDAKYRRMINVTVDITAPLYWWKEFDTYKIGTVANSCSTMHKIHSKEFTLDDFSVEHLYSDELEHFEETIKYLNGGRLLYLDSKKKEDWWQMIQLLPTSYNQKRTVQLNYEVLTGIYPKRKNHKLDEWHGFCDWIKNLPYSEIITLKAEEGT